MLWINHQCGVAQQCPSIQNILELVATACRSLLLGFQHSLAKRHTWRCQPGHHVLAPRLLRPQTGRSLRSFAKLIPSGSSPLSILSTISGAREVSRRKRLTYLRSTPLAVARSSRFIYSLDSSCSCQRYALAKAYTSEPLVTFSNEATRSGNVIVAEHMRRLSRLPTRNRASNYKLGLSARLAGRFESPDS